MVNDIIRVVLGECRYLKGSSQRLMQQMNFQINFLYIVIYYKKKTCKDARWPYHGFKRHFGGDSLMDLILTSVYINYRPLLYITTSKHFVRFIPR